MALKQARSRENQNFKLLELRKITTGVEADKVVNGIAVNETHQLLFVVSGNAIRVIEISKALDFAYSKNVIKQTVDVEPFVTLPLNFQPDFISTSYGSQRVLYVSGQAGGAVYSYIYDVATIARTKSAVPFASLPPLTASIWSLEWHPEFGDSLFIASVDIPS